jgi:hypothetical protein
LARHTVRNLLARLADRTAKRAIIAAAKNALCVPGVTLPILPWW